MNSAQIVNNLLENEDDFDLVDEIDGLPDRPRRWIQKTEVWYDEEDVPFDQTASPPVYFQGSETLVSEVVSHLDREGACFASKSWFEGFEPGIYYMTKRTDPEDDPEYPHEYEGPTCHSQFIWRLGNFSPEEELAIFNAMHGY